MLALTWIVAAVRFSRPEATAEVALAFKRWTQGPLNALPIIPSKGETEKSRGREEAEEEKGDAASHGSILPSHIPAPIK